MADIGKDSVVSRIDLLLVNAPSRAEVYGKLAPITAAEPPVWAGLIAIYCLARGFTVEILDAEAEGYDVAQTTLLIAGKAPLLTVFCVYGHQPSASTQCMPGAIAVAKMLRSVSPTLNTMVMGTHPSALPERTLADGPFEYVCQGEGPVTISELLAALKNG